MPPRRHARPLLAALMGVWLAVTASPAAAQGLLRDAGVEHALDTLARPLLTAAGLPARRTRVLVVDDMSLNAFVADRNAVFIHAGLLLRLEEAQQLQAVIAHELAHIANGHFARRRMNAQAARNRAMLGLAVGVAVGAASGNPGAGAGIAAGSAGTATNIFLSHTREEEAAADKSGMHYLARAGIAPEAMAGVMEIFAGRESLTPQGRNDYARTHPLSSERLRAIRDTAAALEPAGQAGDPEAAAYWFDRAQAKLSAYMRTPAHTFRRYTGDGDADRIARALAHYKAADMTAARAEIAALREARPEDAYIPELLGWIEMEAGNPRRAVPAYEAAAERASREPLILAGLGRALLALETPEADARALEALEAARARDRRDARMLRDLAVAYARAGQNGEASLATAERYALHGAIEDAAIHARRAAGALPTGSPGWARAQDIIRAAEQSQGR